MVLVMSFFVSTSSANIFGVKRNLKGNVPVSSVGKKRYKTIVSGMHRRQFLVMLEICTGH